MNSGSDGSYHYFNGDFSLCTYFYSKSASSCDDSCKLTSSLKTLERLLQPEAQPSKPSTSDPEKIALDSSKTAGSTKMF